MYCYVDFKIVLDFPLLSHCYGGSFILKMVFLLVGFSFFPFVFVGGVLCVCLSIYYTRLLFCLFWACESVEFLWRAGSYFLSVWGSSVWNVGPVQFI